MAQLPSQDCAEPRAPVTLLCGRSGPRGRALGGQLGHNHPEKKPFALVRSRTACLDPMAGAPLPPAWGSPALAFTESGSPVPWSLHSAGTTRGDLGPV